MTRRICFLALLPILAFLAGCKPTCRPTIDVPQNGFIHIANGHFMMGDSVWFPIMLNYKTDICNDSVVPARYYGDGTFDGHFSHIAQWEFNSVRVCLDMELGAVDTCRLFASIDTLLASACRNNLRVMLLIRPPFDKRQTEYTIHLMSHLAFNTTLWAYDFFNEPLYFDPVADRSKTAAYRTVSDWRILRDTYAPRQLFTIGFAEPIEVFEWDPSILPVDFIEMHTYHPLRIASEMYWYGHYCGKPWMVGETSLPADGDSVPYDWQSRYMLESFQCAIDNGAIGFGWWEFQDCLSGTNFEAWYSGLRNSQGLDKPASDLVKRLNSLKPQKALRPVNYSNMLGYHNLAIEGLVVDASSHAPIEGAVVRGWNDDWGVGINTFSDDAGKFYLVSNDRCTHFEISAPGYECIKFYRRPNYPHIDSLPQQRLEYQSIDYRHFLASPESLLTFDSAAFPLPKDIANMGEIKLHRLNLR